MRTIDLEKQFLILIENSQRIIYKVCYIYANNDYTLEELYQETVINLWKSYPRFRGDCKESTWVYRIAMCTCVTYFRRSSVRVECMPITSNIHELPACDDSENEKLDRLYVLINRLGKLERALILLWLEERSYQEISEILGISKSNVAVKLNRVKDKLKRMSNR